MCPSAPQTLVASRLSGSGLLQRAELLVGHRAFVRPPPRQRPLLGHEARLDQRRLLVVVAQRAPRDSLRANEETPWQRPKRPKQNSKRSCSWSFGNIHTA